MLLLVRSIYDHHHHKDHWCLPISSRLPSTVWNMRSFFINSLITLPTFTLISFLLFTSATAATFVIHNYCPFTVWAAASPSGGRRLDQDQSWILFSEDKVNRIWGRTNCDFDGVGRGKCQTGDCDGLLECQVMGSPPNTIAEFKVNGLNKLDFFDVSLVDGFNLPMEIAPTSETCKGVNCTADVSGLCPSELRAPGGCNGPCTGTRSCGPTAYSIALKKLCPDVYTYPQDDATSTFTCPTGTAYVVSFCPGGSSGSNLTVRRFFQLECN